MKRHRQLIAAASLAALIVIAASAAIALQGGSAPPAASVAAAGNGPFFTAATMPQGLGGRRVPRFDLSDARGGRLSSASLAGRPYALTLLYAHCVDVCPLIGSEIRDALAMLGGQATAMNVVAISVDPRGDTRDAVQRWLAVHNEPANFQYLIGPPRQLAPVWKAFYVSPQIPGDPHSSHTAVIWLINRHGRLAALTSAGVPVNIRNLAHDFHALIAMT